jgi:hypothetical protein
LPPADVPVAAVDGAAQDAPAEPAAEAAPIGDAAPGGDSD